MPTPRIDVKQIDNITVAMTRDMKLNDDLVIQEWSDQLVALIDDGAAQKLIVNFERVLFMSSSALRGLITLNKKVRENNIPMVLCAIDENIMEAFRITRLDSVFTIKKTEDEAVRTIVLMGD